MEVGKLLSRLKEYGCIQSIERFRVGYDMDNALKCVDEIGKAMNPRFVIDEDNRFVYENMIRWINGDNNGFQCIDPKTREIRPGNPFAGIYIAGPTGTGKSFIIDLFSFFCRVDNVQIQFDGSENNRRCLSWTAFRSDQICEEYTRTGSVDRYKKMNVMAIQDVGSEPEESMYMGNRMNVMRQILEYRGDMNNQITLISSNLPIDHKITKDRYGDRVVSRLHSMFNYYELKGKDRRI